MSNIKSKEKHGMPRMHMAERMRKCVSAAAGLLYPARCPGCDEVTGVKAGFLCGNCRDTFRTIGESRCGKCGKPLAGGPDRFCGDCQRVPHLFESGRSLYEYGSVAGQIYRFKYGKRKEYAVYFGQSMAEEFGGFLRETGAQALVPVPLSEKKLRDRGYNQAYLLAAEMGKRLRIPVESNLIKRVRDTAPMKLLSPSERHNNLKNAFIICQNDVKLDTIVIIDDIYTTGATIDAIASVFKEHGTKNVFFVTLASGGGTSEKMGDKL